MNHSLNDHNPKPWVPGYYRIEIAGDLDKTWSDRLGGMRIVTDRTTDGENVTTLTGRLADQAELAGVLFSLYEMHFTLLSVNRLSEPVRDQRRSTAVQPPE